MATVSQSSSVTWREALASLTWDEHKTTLRLAAAAAVVAALMKHSLLVVLLTAVASGLLAFVYDVAFARRHLTGIAQISDDPLAASEALLYNYFKASAFMVAASTFFVPITGWWLYEGFWKQVLIVACMYAYFGYLFLTLRTAVADDDGEQVLVVWQRMVLTMAAIGLAASAVYFGVRWLQWNGIARLPATLPFGVTQTKAEIMVLYAVFLAALWGISRPVAAAAARLAAANAAGAGEDDDDGLDEVSLAALYGAMRADQRRAPVRADGRSFGARARSGRSPYGPR